MKKFILQAIVNAIALYVAVNLVNVIIKGGISFQDNSWAAILVLGIIFGLVNAIIRPILMVLSCPLLILTLGHGTLVINTAMFALSGWLGSYFKIGFNFPNGWFIPSLLGAICVSIISLFLSWVFGIRR